MDEEFDSGYHSFRDNASISSSGPISPNSTAIEQLQQKYFEESRMKKNVLTLMIRCVYESIMDSCSKPCDVLEARNVSSAEIVSSAVKIKPTKHQCHVCGETYRETITLLPTPASGLTNVPSAARPLPRSPLCARTSGFTLARNRTSAEPALVHLRTTPPA
ncbi:uncharacterized protein LOC128180700 [Crassostrea angulata]|uniref:uncharacterized protein LOC128180700 n=1 Tax=Magallana angulata TaxID=2784310 RepID=UPI0022B153FF|nr:uncharacterized protein LOC128180700 [Crassostrea angulata]